MKPSKQELSVIVLGAFLGIIMGAAKAFSTRTVVNFLAGGEEEDQPSPRFMVTLYQNGALDNGVNAMLPTEDVCGSTEALVSWAARSLGGLEDHQEAGDDDDTGGSFSGCTLYDETARLIESCSDLAHQATTGGGGGASSSDADNDSVGATSSSISLISLWVVAPDRWFVFPTGSLGRAVTIDRVQPPRGKDHPVRVETVSHSPRVFHLHNFLTEAESDALVAYSLANNDPILGLQRSTTGAEHQVSFNKVRTSENAFDSSSPTAKNLLSRSMDLLGMTGEDRPFDSQMTDGLQVLRYNESKAYIAHVDYLEDNGSGHDYDSSGKGSNRFATVFFYLSDVEEGGETLFAHGQAVDDGEVDVVDGVVRREPPFTDKQVLQQLRDGNFYSKALEQKGPDGGDGMARRLNNGSLVTHPFTKSSKGKEVGPSGVDPLSLFKRGTWEQDMLAMCRSKLAVRPKKAHAVLFYSQHPDGRLDPMSKHGGCPVLKGTKWAANLWIWNKVRLGYPRAPRKAGAGAFDASKGIGRDRMKKGSDDGKGAAGAAAAPTQLSIEFSNADVTPSAKLYYGEDSFMGDLPPGAPPLRFNTYLGHKWVVKDDAGEVIGRYDVDSRPSQSFRVSSSGSGGGGGSSSGGGEGVLTRKGKRGSLPPRPPNARPPA